MNAPILQITVLQGPRNGEILVCKPESTIQIGRVIRGNNMALRDSGISQKHLRFQFIQEDTRWFVSDLDSSNGTILNGLRIQALVLVPVSDGDVFQIGEKTTLGVKIVTPMVLEEKEEVNNARRSRVSRRGGSSRVSMRASSSWVSEEEAGLKEAQSGVSALVRGRRNNARPISARISNEEEKNEETLDPDLVDLGVEVGQKGRGRGRKIGTMSLARVLEEEKESRDFDMFSYSETKESDQCREAKLRRNPRRGSSSRVLKELDGNFKVDSGIQVKEVGVKREGRGRGKGKTSTVSEEERENDENLVLGIEELDGNLKVDSGLQVKEVGMKREGRGRGKGKASTLSEEERENDENAILGAKEVDGNFKIDSGLQVKEVGMKRKGRGRGKGKASTVSEEERENVENAILGVKEVDENFKIDSGPQVKEVGMKREGRGREKSKASTVSEEDRENENLVLRVDSECADPHSVAIPELRKGTKTKIDVNSSMVIEDKVGEDAGVKKGEKRTSKEARVDFENMTLDEWFDSLELFLPTEIYEESEKIIGILKEKARKFDELLEAGSDEA